jgi:hypothetical protein
MNSTRTKARRRGVAKNDDVLSVACMRTHIAAAVRTAVTTGAVTGAPDIAKAEKGWRDRGCGGVECAKTTN